MQERLVDKLSEPFKLETPIGQTMAMKIESVLGVLKGKSKSLRQTEYYVNSHWAELHDDPKQIEDVLVMFRHRSDDGDPVSSGAFETYRDGKLYPGRWRDVGEGKISISQSLVDQASFKMTFKSEFDAPTYASDQVDGSKIPEETILYRVAFLDEDFIILRRHGNLPDDAKDSLGSKRYRLFVRERLINKERFEWDDALEYLLTKYRSMATYYLAAVAFFVLLLILIVTYSN
ncbi:MAG: hypothetical protein AAFP08_07945 [Bacteroidota bacterium]